MPDRRTRSSRLEPGAATSPQPTHEEICARAYSIYEARSGGAGDALGDWLQAEAELREASAERDEPAAWPPALRDRRSP